MTMTAESYTLMVTSSLLLSAVIALSTTPSTNYVIDSVECRVRNSCLERLIDDNEDEIERNCMCDDKCHLYDDCCHDKPRPSVNNDSLKAVLGCMSLPDINATSSIYVINRCPAANTEVDDVTRKRCEAAAETTAPLVSLFDRVPVTGDVTGAVYRNAFCATCNGGVPDGKHNYWVAKLDICTPDIKDAADRLRSNITELIKVSSSSGCRLTFHRDVHSAKLITPTTNSVPATRSCRPSVISKCDRKWLDRSTSRMCRDGPAGFVFAGRRTFRNRHCAVCNHVNETYLRCAHTEQVTANGSSRITGVTTRSPMDETYLLIDFNERRATLHGDIDYEDSYDEYDETTFQFPVCSDASAVYDPFSAACVKLTACRAGSKLVQGRCQRDVAQSDDVTSLTRSTYPDDDSDETDDVVKPYPTPALDYPRSTTALDVAGCPLSGGFLLPVNASDYRSYPNGSVYVESLQKMFNADQCRHGTDRKVYVCVDHSNGKPSAKLQPFRVVMYSLGDIERLVSIIGACISAVCYFCVLLSCCLFGCARRGGDAAGKSVTCLVVCLFVRCVAYVLVITGQQLETRHEFVADIAATGRGLCFYSTTLLQFSSLASFFWLSVLSVEIYRRLGSQTPQSNHPCVDFLFYSLYAWTMPALAVGWSIAVSVLGYSTWYPSAAWSENSNRPEVHSEVGARATCWVLGFIELLLFVVPAFAITFVDVILYIISGCRMCLGDAETPKSAAADKSISLDDQLLLHPWRRATATSNGHDNQPQAFGGRQGDEGTKTRMRRMKDLYVCCVQMTLLMSISWTLGFVASTLPLGGSSGSAETSRSLLWYLYIAFDVALAVSTMAAITATEHDVCLRLTTRRRKWPSQDLSTSATKRHRRATGPGDVIVVGDPPTSSFRMPVESEATAPTVGIALESSNTYVEPAEGTSDASQRLLMKETCI